MMTLSKLRLMLDAAGKLGVFDDDWLYDHEPAVTSKLFQDREILLKALKLILPRLHPSSAGSLIAKNAIAEAETGWPKENADV